MRGPRGEWEAHVPPGKSSHPASPRSHCHALNACNLPTGPHGTPHLLKESG